jgi:Ca-activated chloride channel family protein
MKAAALVAICTLLALPLQSGQRQPYTLSVDVDLIVLNVRVLDKKGESIHGLTKEHFDVRDNGNRQEIGLFIGQDSPATIGLVLDSSASMNSKYSDVRAGALRFVHSSHPQDQIFLLYFNERLHWPLAPGPPFTDNVDTLVQALSWNELGGRTALYDSLQAALEHSGRGQWEKRALIVLTDGGDNASVTKLDKILQLARQSNVTIYAIGLFDPLAVGSNRQALKTLAKLTGGDAYFPNSIEELAPVWEEIAHGIRTQYTIGYQPSVTMLDGKPHTIKVRAATPGQPKLRVHTRPGYLARKALNVEQSDAEKH